MSLLDRLLKRNAVDDPAARDATAEPAALAARSDEPIAAAELGDIVRVEETGDAAFFAGELFRRRFRQEPPAFPHHYVAFYRGSPERYLVTGYVHYTRFEDSYLCGGLVIDDRLYRRMPAPHRALIRAAGGIAEVLLRESFARLAHAPAIFGYVGDKQAEAVDLRVGFRHTAHRHVMVAWQRELSDEDKAARLARVVALGPF